LVRLDNIKCVLVVRVRKHVSRVENESEVLDQFTRVNLDFFFGFEDVDRAVALGTFEVDGPPVEVGFVAV